VPKELSQLDRLLGRGLSRTADLWPTVETAYGWVHRAAHLLANHEELDGDGVRRRYEALLAELRHDRETAGAPALVVDHFLKVTASYWPGLFPCYDLAGLPRTNNDLEHFFASARYHERRASGRCSASPGTVVRGSVRLVAAVATRLHSFTADELASAEVAQWRTLRQELEERHEARRAQRRFRRDPAAYLAALEERLAEQTLPP
jgi:hypothetical protein